MQRKHIISLSSILSMLGCALSPAQTDHLNYQTKTHLIFPITGESLIGTGGRTINQNPDHIVSTDQRFGIDIVALKPGSAPPDTNKLVERILSGKVPVFSGSDYTDISSHYCYGMKIVAPGDGIVADARDGIADNIPGERNEAEPAGNHVVIDHLNGEFSMLAHFQQGSVLVEVNDEVSAGDEIGLCGNSGRSNLPHLHYHLQSTGNWHSGEGLPAQFVGYRANGELVEVGEPVQGQIISTPAQ